MGLRPTDGDEDLLHWWRELQLAATASAGVRPLFRGVRMSPQLTKGDENAFCGARLQACRVDSRVDVLPFLRSDAKSTRYALFSGERSAPEFSDTLVSQGIACRKLTV